MRDPALRKLRALRIIEARIVGQSLAQIGATLGVEARTVMDEIAWAKRQGLFDTLENTILETLAPAAIATIQHALVTNNDSAVALEVMKGIGLFRKPAERQQIALPAAQGGEESLELHVRRISSNRPQEISPARETNAISGRAGEVPALGPAPIEAELVESREQARSENPDRGMDQPLGLEPDTLEQHLAPRG